MRTPTLEDLTLPGTELADHPYPVLARLRERGPVHRIRTADSGEVWLIVGHDEARAALTDVRLRNDVRHSAAGQDDGGHTVGRNMLQVDPPHHTRLRRLVAGQFTTRRIEALAPRIRTIADELLDAMVPLGRADLVESFATPLPMAVICELLGVPDTDRKAFTQWSSDVVTPGSPHAAASAEAMTGYLTDLIDAKSGGDEDDLLSALVGGRGEDGDRLTSEETLGMAFLLLVAGHETTVNLISSGVFALLLRPEQLAALRADRGLLQGAVEEMLRHESPLGTSAFRYTSEAVELAGTTIPAGQPVLVVLSAANRDPRRFPDPDRFDIRRDARGHLAFSHGVHHCLGAPLARLEASIALGALLERCPGLRLAADPADLTWRSGLMRGLHRLPVAFGQGGLGARVGSE
ncbi:cytochrome P450 [Streptomyces sp. A012304]|uniref:cytochrome P450 family protein n=1 Tax=Streptomyces sp. A012304 TaxID=375446 RepID=UPI00222E1FC0|nr:cytochrome P450 [Streptomyces sp. A012304]GKQ38799.1 cytochrome P450 [Streptomyces sp. A012304]